MRWPGSSRKAGKLRSFLHQFSSCLLRLLGKATKAVETDGHSAGKAHNHLFEEIVVTTSGALWGRQAYWKWQLLESNGVETETAVCELLEYFGVPIVTGACEGLQQGIDLRILTALYDLGVPLDVESLKKSNKTETKHCNGRCQLCTCEQQGNSKNTQ